MTLAREDHRHAQLIRPGNNFTVFLGATRLSHRANARCVRCFNPIRKWEKRVGAHGGTFKHVPVLQRFFDRQFYGVDTRGLPAASTQQLTGTGKGDGIASNWCAGGQPEHPFVIGGLAFINTSASCMR